MEGPLVDVLLRYGYKNQDANLEMHFIYISYTPPKCNIDAKHENDGLGMHFFSNMATLDIQ